MSADDTPRRDGVTDRYDGDPYDDEPTGADDSQSPYSWPPWGAGWGWGWPSGYWWGTDEEPGDADRPSGSPRTDDDTWLDEGIYTLLILVGVALFLFPEPGTSMVGILLMIAGGIGWVIDAVA